MATEFENVQAMLKVEDELQATRGRIYGSEYLSSETRDLLSRKLVELQRQKEELAAAAAPPAPAPIIPAGITAAQAKVRAAEIRARPEYWGRTAADGKRLTEEEHQRLVREHSELLARAAEQEA